MSSLSLKYNDFHFSSPLIAAIVCVVAVVAKQYNNIVAFRHIRALHISRAASLPLSSACCLSLCLLLSMPLEFVCGPSLRLTALYNSFSELIVRIFSRSNNSPGRHYEFRIFSARFEFRSRLNNRFKCKTKQKNAHEIHEIRTVRYSFDRSTCLRVCRQLFEVPNLWWPESKSGQPIKGGKGDIAIENNDD